MPDSPPSFAESKKRRRSPSPRHDRAQLHASHATANASSAQSDMLRRMRPPIARSPSVQPASSQFAQTATASGIESQPNAPAVKRYKGLFESEAGNSATAASAPEPTGYEAISTPEPLDLDPQTLNMISAFLREMPDSPALGGPPRNAAAETSTAEPMTSHVTLGAKPIEQADAHLSLQFYDLATDYPDGIRSDYARAFVVATDIIAYVRNQLHHGSANQRWNQQGSGQPHNDELANRSAEPINEALMRTQFIDHHSGRCLPENELSRFAWSQIHSTEDRRELARRIAQAFMWSNSPEPGDAQHANAQAASTRPDFAALGQEMLRYKPRLIAHTAYAVAAGNDDHMAAFAYTDARHRLNSSYVVQLMQMPDHTFCRIGMPAWPEAHWWVIDPWPRDAYPVRFEHHLGYGKSQVLASKPGKGAPCSDEKLQRYRALRRSMAHRLQEFREWTWPGINARTRVMHNCLYPTKDPIQGLYTVLVRQPDVGLTPQYHRISREHEDTRVVVAGVIRDVKASLKYGSENQLWNFERGGQTGNPEGADQSQERYVETRLRMNFLRNADPSHLSDDEMRRFAESDHRGAPYRIDLAGQIQRLLFSRPNENGAGSALAPDAQASLDMLRGQVLRCKRRLSAFTALGAEVGNCGEFADVSYMLARQRFGPEYTVAFATTAIPEHAFCVVGKKDWPLDLWWVIDAWPRDAYPVLAQHYFGYENIRRGVAKPGKGIAHSLEQQMRYARLRGDVAKKYQEFRQSKRAQHDNDMPQLANARFLMYNCLYPAADPVKWHYYVSATDFS